MTTRMLDTNVASYWFKNDPRIRKYQKHIVGRSLVLSFQAVAELWVWADSSNRGAKKRSDLEVFLRRFQVVESDPMVTRLWALVRHQRRHQPIGLADAWIAATALAYNLELVTHNPADFAGIAGLAVITETT